MGACNPESILRSAARVASCSVLHIHVQKQNQEEMTRPPGADLVRGFIKSLSTLFWTMC